MPISASAMPPRLARGRIYPHLFTNPSLSGPLACTGYNCHRCSVVPGTCALFSTFPIYFRHPSPSFSSYLIIRCLRLASVSVLMPIGDMSQAAHAAKSRVPRPGGVRERGLLRVASVPPVTTVRTYTYTYHLSPPCPPAPDACHHSSPVVHRSSLALDFHSSHPPPSRPPAHTHPLTHSYAYTPPYHSHHIPAYLRLPPR